ncbi:hypothetical protein PHYSODRAFT_312118 [Phytophthora sojae]|uniref:Uncharacterized protein n=1 Tax=Phytophthora sojae (strain P6497) TaxID=1094619 RepID=G4YZQ0_PHYSP|nr:hypothetical protein PHYSODRAFT_312118 [Phytophthora sojae]EGZ25818.1 hypothetical protein PHYSODRAFT_312118 [Phytophthora sojae]|eukprot:XP_009521106.1 hypothetical protein PHYSODRAFT_312118 [Phytophthora sojae]
MGKKALTLNTPGEGIEMDSAKRSPKTKERPRKSVMRQHRKASLRAELAEELLSPQAESPSLKPADETVVESAVPTSSSKGDKSSRRSGRLRSKRADKANNDESADALQNQQSPILSGRRSSIMSWRSRNSTASIVEDAPPASCPLSCQRSACFIGSLNGSISEVHLPLLSKHMKARMNALKAQPKQRNLEVFIERSDELPFGAYSHPQVRVHAIDRCTGRALCPPQMTSEAKFFTEPSNQDYTKILESKPPTKGTRFRRGTRFESVSTHDEDDASHKAPSTTEYRRIAWGFFHTITSKGNPTMNCFVLPNVPEDNDQTKSKSEEVVDVCGLRVRLFEYQVLTWMDNYQAKLQWGWRKNHPTMPAVFLQYQKRTRVPAPTTLHVQLRAASGATADAEADQEASVNPEHRGGDNQEPPEADTPPVGVAQPEDAGSKAAAPSGAASSDQFDLLVPYGTVRLWELPSMNTSSPPASPRAGNARRSRLLPQVLQWHHFPCFVYCASFLPGSNGGTILTGASDGCLRFRKESSVPNGQPEFGMLQVSASALHTICVEAKTGRVFCGDAKGDITVWKRTPNASTLAGYELVKTIQTGQTSITSMELHPRKAHLLVHTQPNAIFQYELRSYLLLNKSYAGVACESLLVKSTFSPDGKLVISGSEDGVPRLFTSLHGQQLQRGVWGTHFFHDCPVLDVSWSPTAHMAALCSYGGNNPIVVLCSYRDDNEAAFMDESVSDTTATATTSLQQLAVDAFRGSNQQDALRGDHAQRLQRALERRQKRLQAKVSQIGHSSDPSTDSTPV